MKLFFWVKPKNNISNARKYGPEKTPYLDTFHAVISSINFHGFSIFIYGIKITSITSVLDELACFFAKKLVLWRSIVLNAKAKISQQPHFFSIWVFTDTDISQESKRRKDTIFIPPHHFHSLTNFQAFICSLASEMTNFCFHRSACNYYPYFMKYIQFWKLDFDWILLLFYLSILCQILSIVASHRQVVIIKSYWIFVSCQWI